MRILLSPLDWGLGHTTRCIPVIRAFLQNNCGVYVACNATQQRLLEQEFTSVKFLRLDGYNIRYASSKRWFAIKILQQIPKIIRVIRREHKWLKQAVDNHKIDIIISDNRYGFYHQKIPCIFITHQLFIQMPYAWLSKVVQKINYRFINRFTECWIPDFKGKTSLAGILSHPKILPSVPVHYIGLLSRFSKRMSGIFTYKWLIVLSGPEPQRTHLEKAILKNFSGLPEKILLIRGLPSGGSHLTLPPHITVFNHLPAEQLEAAFLKSEYVISRSGYSTVMDIIALAKKAVVIPTSGQTEQEYLANHLAQQQWCVECPAPDQIGFYLENIEQFEYRLPEFSNVDAGLFIKQMIAKCSQQK